MSLRASLEGLAVGDAFGERFFGPTEEVIPRIKARTLPPAPWRWTDDTEMALSIVEQLEERGSIDQDDLAQRFARRMDSSRGYGGARALPGSPIRVGHVSRDDDREGESRRLGGNHRTTRGQPVSNPSKG